MVDNVSHLNLGKDTGEEDMGNTLAENIKPDSKDESYTNLGLYLNDTGRLLSEKSKRDLKIVLDYIVNHKLTFLNRGTIICGLEKTIHSGDTLLLVDCLFEQGIIHNGGSTYPGGYASISKYKKFREEHQCQML